MGGDWAGGARRRSVRASRSHRPPIRPPHDEQPRPSLAALSGLSLLLLLHRTRRPVVSTQAFEASLRPPRPASSPAWHCYPAFVVAASCPSRSPSRGASPFSPYCYVRSGSALPVPSATEAASFPSILPSFFVDIAASAPVRPAFPVRRYCYLRPCPAPSHEFPRPTETNIRTHGDSCKRLR